MRIKKEIGLGKKTGTIRFMESSFEIQVYPMAGADWPAVRMIYQKGIDTGNSTFAEKAPDSWQEWSAGKLNDCRFTARRQGSIIGWAALSPVSSREVYQGVAELSIYVARDWREKGVGSRPLQALIEASDARGVWTLQAAVFPENAPSVHLCLKHGFKLLGVREKLGKMTFGPYAGEWRNVAFLERRSKICGL